MRSLFAILVALWCGISTPTVAEEYRNLWPAYLSIKRTLERQSLFSDQNFMFEGETDLGIGDCGGIDYDFPYEETTRYMLLYAAYYVLYYKAAFRTAIPEEIWKPALIHTEERLVGALQWETGELGLGVEPTDFSEFWSAVHVAPIELAYRINRDISRQNAQVPMVYPYPDGCGAGGPGTYAIVGPTGASIQYMAATYYWTCPGLSKADATLICRWKDYVGPVEMVGAYVIRSSTRDEPYHIDVDALCEGQEEILLGQPPPSKCE